MRPDILLALISGAVFAVAYVVWIRPILKKTPTFAEFYAQEESCVSALSLKLGGIKQQLMTALVFVVGGVVSLYDFIAPLAMQSGVDFTKLTDKIPSQDWPFIIMAFLGLMQYFRNLSDRYNRQKICAMEEAHAKAMQSIRSGPAPEIAQPVVVDAGGKN